MLDKHIAVKQKADYYEIKALQSVTRFFITVSSFSFIISQPVKKAIYTPFILQRAIYSLEMF